MKTPLRKALAALLVVVMTAVLTSGIAAAAPPTAPSGVNASVVGGKTTLTWNAATDPDGTVRTYEIHRNGNWAGWTYSGTRTWTDSTAGPGTTNTYTIYAIDNTSSAGPFSAPVTFTNPAGGGNQPPAAPTGLSASVVGGNTTLTWNAAADDRGIRTYEIHRNGNWAGWTYGATRTWTDTAAGPGTTNTYRVYAIDTDQVSGPFTSNLTFTNPAGGGNQPPAAPTGLSASVVGGNTTLTWNATNDPDGTIRTYEIHRNGSWAGWTWGGTRTWTDNSAGAGSTNTYRVYAIDNDSAPGPFSSNLTYTNNGGGGQSVDILAVGDVARCGGQHGPIANLLAGNNKTFLALGDMAYPDGSDADFANCYDPEFGPYKNRTYPTPGNHEYYTPDATGYFNYYGANAGDPDKGYYSFDLGDWHIVVFNSECWEVGGCAPSDPMYQWMEADLAANAGQCVLAYSHRAKYSTQEGASLPTYLNPHWDLLQSYGTDVYLGGHYHLYERYARMDSAGNVDPNGIASFVVGGGGHSLRDYTAATPPGLQNRAKAFGALEMTLNSNGYTFNFVRTGGPEQITDSGTGTC